VSDPSVSVALSVYNGARFIAKAVDSVLGQTFPDFEFVIVDDASDDGTADLLGRYTDPRLHVIRNERQLGHSGAHNRGLAACRAPLIARMDHDDICEPTRLEKQVAFMAANPSAAGCGTCIIEIDDQDREVLRPDGEPGTGEPAYLNWWMTLGNPVWHPTSLLRRDVIHAVGEYGYDHPFAEDFDLFSRIVRAGHDLHVLPERLLRYRRGDFNTTQIKRREQRRDGDRVRRNHLTWLLREPPDEPTSILMRQTLGWLEDPPPAELADQVGAVLDLIRRTRAAAIRRASPSARQAIDRYLTKHLLRRGEMLLASHPAASLAIGRRLLRLAGAKQQGLRLLWRATRCQIGGLRNPK
jgi:glycosyltransferase involved in cell wall biosynthesis